MKVLVVDPGRFSAPYDHCLCNALSDAHAEVTLATSRFLYDDELPRRRYRLWELFFRLSNRLFSRPTANPVRLGLKAAEYVADMMSLINTVHVDRRFDVIHLQWTVMPRIDAWLFKRLSLAGVPIIYTAHNVLPHENGERYRSAFREIYRGVDRVVVHVNSAREQIVEEFGIPFSKVAVIPHGHFGYLDEYEAAPLEELDIRLADKKVVLFFGQVQPYKRLDLLIDAMPEICQIEPAAHLLVVGKFGNDLRRYARQVDSLKLDDSVTFVDRFVPDRIIPSLAALATIAVFPYERICQSGAAIAMASLGVPVIATSVGGLSDIVEPGASGELVAPGDVNALAKACLRVMTNPSVRDGMGCAGRNLVRKKLDWSNIADSTLELYRQAAASDARTSRRDAQERNRES